jgi:hypothetical protein
MRSFRMSKPRKVDSAVLARLAATDSDTVLRQCGGSLRKKCASSDPAVRRGGSGTVRFGPAIVDHGMKGGTVSHAALHVC